MNSKFSRYYVFIKPALKNAYVRTYSSVVFSLIAVTFFSLFAIRPTLKTIFALRQDIEKESQVLNQLTTKAKNLEEGKRNYANLSSVTKNRMDNLIPNKVSVDKLIIELQSAAINNQASISGLRFQPIDIDNNPKKQSKAEMGEVSFTVNFQGQYQNLINFLNNSLSLNRLITIDTINFNKLEGGELVMSLAGRAYLIK